MSAESRERTWHFKQLRWSLQSLAGSASEQRSLFPEWVATADELALDFDHWLDVIRQRYGTELDSAQRDALDAIEHVFERMSRDAAELDADIWSEAALRTSEDWHSLRRLATSALEAFRWPVELPPLDPNDRGTTYVPGGVL